MHAKNIVRKRRVKKICMRIRNKGAIRLVAYRTLKHVYAQIIVCADNGDKVVSSASTLDKEVKAMGIKNGNKDSAYLIGKIIAKRALDKQVSSVVFDRSGFKYNGCIKAIAEGAREGGLEF